MYIFSAVKNAPLLFYSNNLVNQGFFLEKPFFTFMKKTILNDFFTHIED